ncbi:MAG: DUF4350 domain-containing protein [Planctomycetes bacterium]|nr:DUF4350 domain-containing protein [Planctomycetota bacterium]
MKALKPVRFEHVVVLAAVAALVAGGLLFGERPSKPDERQEDRQQGQSRAVTRSGTRALATLLERFGGKVVRHERRLDLIAPDVRVCFVLAASVEPDAQEMDAVWRWMEEGGTLIFAPRSPESWGDPLSRLGLAWEPRGYTGSAAAVEVDVSALGLADTYRVKAIPGPRLRSAPGAPVAARALAEDGGGWIVAYARVGRGEAVVFADLHAARNDALLEEDHSALLAHAALARAEGGRIAFDEYHHGYVEGQSPLAYLMDTPAGGVLIHLVVLGLLVLYGAGRRLGPPRPVLEERRRRPQEFIEAFARLSRAARASSMAVELVLNDVMDSIHKRFGTRDPAMLGRRAARAGLDPEGVRRTLERAQRAGHERVEPADMVSIMKELEALRRRWVRSEERANP